MFSSVFQNRIAYEKATDEKRSMNEPMYFLLKMGIFQLARFVFGGVYWPVTNRQRGPQMVVVFHWGVHAHPQRWPGVPSVAWHQHRWRWVTSHKFCLAPKNKRILMPETVETQNSFIVYTLWKLTCPLQIDGWKMQFPFKMVPFLGICSFSGVYCLFLFERKLVKERQEGDRWRVIGGWPSLNGELVYTSKLMVMVRFFGCGGGKCYFCLGLVYDTQFCSCMP